MQQAMQATAHAPIKPSSRREEAEEAFLTLTVAGQLCGVPVLAVRDVLGAQAITRIPLAPREVAGSLNLRGRIVTAIDLRRRLGLPPRERGGAVRDGTMSVVVERDGELYSLLADSVGEVLPLPSRDRAANPPTLDPLWRDVSRGVHRLGERLLILLDVEQVLAIGA
jgi:purine-binding chemotaxis protein CheW